MKKITLVVFFILFSTVSCSRLDLAMSLANSYIANKADDYFNLTWEQSKWLKDVLVKDISKVKKEIFPRLGSEMLKVADLLSAQTKFETNTIMVHYVRLENLFYEGLEIFTPTASSLVDKLIPGQVQYFQKKAEEKLLEMKEDPQKKNYKKMKNNFDSWMGGMTSNQKKELKNFVENNPPPTQEIIYNRQRLVHAFIKSYPDKIARRKFIEEIFTNYQSGVSINYKKIIDEKNIKVASFVKDILNKISLDQKKVLVETIRDRANQIIKISKN